jgi:hypothetical protein
VIFPIGSISPAQLGIVTGVLMILFLRYKLLLPLDRKQFSLKQYVMDSAYDNYFFITATFLQFLIMSPFFIILFAYYELYKYVIGLQIRRKYGKHFHGFLDGSDVVWALGEDVSRGVINVMAFIEEAEMNERSCSEILLSLRKRISSKLMRNTQPHPKMFYKRTQEMGYLFWTDLSELTIEDYIRYLEIIPSAEAKEGCVDWQDLRKFLSQLSNSKLPGDHSSSWEILVGRQPVFETERALYKYPVRAQNSKIRKKLKKLIFGIFLILDYFPHPPFAGRWSRLTTTAHGDNCRQGNSLQMAKTVKCI